MAWRDELSNQLTVNKQAVIEFVTNQKFVVRKMIISPHPACQHNHRWGYKAKQQQKKKKKAQQSMSVQTLAVH